MMLAVDCRAIFSHDMKLIKKDFMDDFGMLVLEGFGGLLLHF